MIQKTKKQHFIPQFYLSAWSISGNHQIHVYDKVAGKQRINNIKDVASEHDFYDFCPSEVFSEDFIRRLHQEGMQFNAEEKIQGIERAFSEEIETPFSILTKEIIGKASNATPWIVGNCFFLNENKKEEFSVYLALQFIRTKRIREGIRESSDCLSQVLTEMGVPFPEAMKYSLSKDNARKIHVQMLLDGKEIAEISRIFNNYNWILGINRTKKGLFTSDNPIGTYGHVKHPYISTNGLASRGVEVFFPLSPEVILLMVDGSYHTHCRPLERRYIEITRAETIDYYNSLLAMQARQDIYSDNGDFTLIEYMKKRDPDVFAHPHVQLSWGGKKYYPSKK